MNVFSYCFLYNPQTQEYFCLETNLSVSYYESYVFFQISQVLLLNYISLKSTFPDLSTRFTPELLREHLAICFLSPQNAVKCKQREKRVWTWCLPVCQMRLRSSRMMSTSEVFEIWQEGDYQMSMGRAVLQLNNDGNQIGKQW